jgi:hypothetical protein
MILLIAMSRLLAFDYSCCPKGKQVKIPVPWFLCYGVCSVYGFICMHCIR